MLPECTHQSSFNLTHFCTQSTKQTNFLVELTYPVGNVPHPGNLADQPQIHALLFQCYQGRFRNRDLVRSP
jgi:hypothetical protein